MTITHAHGAVWILCVSRPQEAIRASEEMADTTMACQERRCPAFRSSISRWGD